MARLRARLAERCGLDLEGSTIGVHEPGWVPVAPLAAYLLSGRGGVLTSCAGPPSDRYVTASVRAVLESGLAAEGVADQVRRARIADLIDADAPGVLAATGAEIATGVDPSSLPLGGGTVDLCHSGARSSTTSPPSCASRSASCVPARGLACMTTAITCATWMGAGLPAAHTLPDHVYRVCSVIV
jgi:hypothetical protein